MPWQWPRSRPASRSFCRESGKTAFCSASSGAPGAGRGLFLLALLADAALQLFALLALAGLADLGAAGGGFLHLRLAFRRVLRLRAHLAAHAIAPFLALLAFAGLARLLVRGLRLGEALLAGLGILRLRAVEALLGALLRGLRRRLREERGGECRQCDASEGAQHGESFHGGGNCVLQRARLPGR